MNRMIGWEQGKEREMGARRMPKERQHNISEYVSDVVVSVDVF